MTISEQRNSFDILHDLRTKHTYLQINNAIQVINISISDIVFFL